MTEPLVREVAIRNVEFGDNVKSTLALERNDKFTALGLRRFDRDLELVTENYKAHVKHLEELKDKRRQEEGIYKGMVELQTLIGDADKYCSEIEQMHIQLAFLAVKIKSMEQANEVLEDQKDRLDA